jgi:proline iminopeptidase
MGINRLFGVAIVKVANNKISYAREETMGRKKFSIIIIPLLFSLYGTTCEAGSKLWPPLKPYKTDYLQASQLHKIFYQLGGNPEGKPVMVIHGGPGGGCSPDMFRFFNPDKFHIILHDQRGAGQSQPYAEIKENTIQYLVDDIEKLRTHLGLGRVLLFGGSWGSTLALAYAETYPQNVSGMVLRGIFMGSSAEIDHFYHGETARYFPENYERLLKHIDQREKKNYPAQLLEKIQSPDSATRKKYALAWAKYEIKMAALQISDKMVDDIFKEWNPYDFALLENYYMANNCFLEEGQLMKNADKLRDIPMTIVNGRYDVICPPITAYNLHKKLPNSKLIIVERAGHSASAEPLRTVLVNAVKAFE